MGTDRRRIVLIADRLHGSTAGIAVDIGDRTDGLGQRYFVRERGFTLGLDPEVRWANARNS